MKARMTRKVETASELRTTGTSETVIIEKTVILTDAQYNDFASDLFEARTFIEENIDLMFQDSKGAWHCILVTTEYRKGGILVESEGYEYARYAARYNG